MKCDQRCPWNYTNIGIGCKKPNEEMCPLSNIATKTKPQTNADRIRAMSDEELGRFIAEVENRRSAAGGGAIWKGAAHAIQWLKQPAKGE